VRTLEARAGESNSAESVPNSAVPTRRQGGGEQGDERDVTAMNVARVWGDAVGSEVQVRAFGGRKVRVELPFDSLEEALAMGELVAEKIARGSKRNKAGLAATSRPVRKFGW
jgi:hypothetical protein